jgi:hypothetical protein
LHHYELKYSLMRKLQFYHFGFLFQALFLYKASIVLIMNERASKIKNISTIIIKRSLGVLNKLVKEVNIIIINPATLLIKKLG